MLALAWLTQVLRMLDEAIIRGASIPIFLSLTFAVMPNILSQILPLALFIASIFVLNTMGKDNESIILLSSGINNFRILKPFIIFSIFITIFLTIISLYVAPAGMRYSKLKMHELKNDLSSTILRDGLFSMPAKGLTVYAKEKNLDNSIKGVLVHDNRDPKNSITYTAKKGLFINENNEPKLILIEGSIQHKNSLKPESGITTVTFEKNDYSFSEFLPESERFNFDSSQRFINELLFPDKNDLYAKNRINNLRAVGHHKLSQLFHPLIFILFSFCFLINKIQSKTNPTAINIIAITLGFSFQILDFFLLGFAQSSIIGILMLYLLPFLCLFSVLFLFNENFDYFKKV
tara:strand:- start:6773 stop:7813 length:1041 start_codon:yes stop_codon:yes gene_type:complete